MDISLLMLYGKIPLPKHCHCYVALIYSKKGFIKTEVFVFWVRYTFGTALWSIEATVWLNNDGFPCLRLNIATDAPIAILSFRQTPMWKNSCCPWTTQAESKVPKGHLYFAPSSEWLEQLSTTNTWHTRVFNYSSTTWGRIYPCEVSVESVSTVQQLKMHKEEVRQIWDQHARANSTNST